MNKRLIIALLLLAFSLFHPALYYYYEGEHVKVNESLYKVRDNSKNHTSEIEKYAQMRILYQAYKNIKLNRVFAMSNIDDNTVANSYPIYQYYNFGISHLLGLVVFVTQNVIVAYTIGIWLFSLLCVTGLYLLVTKISKSRKTAFLTILIFLTYPYFLVNLLTRYAFTEYLAISMVPMLLYLATILLERGNRFLLKAELKEQIEYVFIVSLFILLGSLFIITHNITTLFTPVILGIPFLVYLIYKIKPTFQSVLLLIVPIVVMIINSLFILVPVAQNQNTLLISGSFSGLLFDNFGLNDLSIATRLFPFTSPLSGQPYLTLQFGLPILLFAIAFFRWKSLHIYALVGIVVWMVLAPTIWHILPPIFYVTQFSMRMFTYVPLLLIFAAQPLSKNVTIALVVVTFFFGYFFIQRPNNPGQMFSNDYDEFPSENQWNYRTIGQNPSIPAPRAVDPPNDVIEPVKLAENKYLIESLSNYDLKRKAVTYMITVPPQEKKDLYYARPIAVFKDGRKTQTYAELLPENNTIFLSYCIPNTKKLDVHFETPKTSPEIIEVKRLTEQQYMHIDTTLIPASCDYEYINNGQEYLFTLDPKFEETQLLTVFYSPYNVVTGEDNKVLETKPFLDAAQRSYTVVMDRKESKTIRVKLSSGNIWIPISTASLKLSFALTLISATYLLASLNRKNKTL
jgi:hypothetical protein